MNSNWSAPVLQAAIDSQAARMDAEKLEFMRKHHGHESLHAMLLMGLLMFLLLAQAILVYWKKRSPLTYDRVSLAGLLLFPPLFSFARGYWRFLITWILFIATSSYFLSKPFLERPMRLTTPRLVYWFFFLCNKVSFGLAFLGYCGLMVDALTGSSFSLGPSSLLFLFYGLLYGVISRDLALLCADRMASSLGSLGGTLPTSAVDPRVCAVCGEDLNSISEDSVALPACGHVFHSFCIRGWSIVGKHECPRCKERVQLSEVFQHPWEKQSIVWSYVLDITRYLVVWNPLIVGASSLLIRLIDS